MPTMTGARAHSLNTSCMEILKVHFHLSEFISPRTSDGTERREVYFWLGENKAHVDLVILTLKRFPPPTVSLGTLTRATIVWPSLC